MQADLAPVLRGRIEAVSHLGFSLRFLPSGFGSLGSDLGAFGFSHGFQAALPADLAALATDGRHILRNVGG